MNSPSLSGSASGSLSALLPDATPQAVGARLRGSVSEAGGESQAADFNSFFSFLAGAAQNLSPAASAAATGVWPLTGDRPATADAPVEGLPTLLRLTAAGGRFAPATGSGLPVGLPLPAALAGAAGPGAPKDAALTALATLTAAPAGAAAATPSPATEALAPLASAYTGVGPAPAPWMRALLPGDRHQPLGEIQPAGPDEAIATGDAMPGPGVSHRSAATAAPVVVPASPSQQPAFEQALGDRLAWLVQEGRHDARIKLHPAELGSIDIRLSLDGDATKISLASPHAAVRDALEQAVPRLRELLGHAGFDLGQVDVGAGDTHSPGHPGREPAGFGPDYAGPAGREFDVDDAGVPVVSLAMRIPRGLVDTFA